MTASEYYEYGVWCTALINIVIPSCMIRFADNRSSVWEVRGYLRGRLREYANYPLDNRNMDSTLGPYFESYSEAGELTEKYVYVLTVKGRFRYASTRIRE